MGHNSEHRRQEHHQTASTAKEELVECLDKQKISNVEISSEKTQPMLVLVCVWKAHLWRGRSPDEMPSFTVLRSDNILPLRSSPRTCGLHVLLLAHGV
ncbi:hypothetical protein ACOMHN_064747 [Nucella lapillus]